MKLKFTPAFLLVTTILVSVSFSYPGIAIAQPSAGGYVIGANASDFKLKNINGGSVSLADFKDAKGYIVVFTDMRCKQSVQYDKRLVALDKKYRSKGYPVIAIDPNGSSAGVENLQEQTKKMHYSFPYLIDENQQTAKVFGAVKTPSVYVIKKEGEKYIVKYIGAIDDYAADAENINYPYVQDAVNALLKAQPVVKSSTEIDGCDIR